MCKEVLTFDENGKDDRSKKKNVEQNFSAVVSIISYFWVCGGDPQMRPLKASAANNSQKRFKIEFSEKKNSKIQPNLKAKCTVWELPVDKQLVINTKIRHTFTSGCWNRIIEVESKGDVHAADKT